MADSNLNQRHIARCWRLSIWTYTIKRYLDWFCSKQHRGAKKEEMPGRGSWTRTREKER